LLQDIFSLNKDLLKLNAELEKVWEETVRRVLPEGELVALAMDWSALEAQLTESLSETGFFRHMEWISKGLKRHRGELEVSHSKRLRI
jgi:hypothetical protein